MSEQLTIDIKAEAIPISSEQLANAEKEKAQIERALERRAQLEEEMLRYKVGLRIIGRDEALTLHEHNKFNRNKSKSHVRKLAQFQLNDQWLFNGMSIVLNGANELGIGEVLDGEHRIESVIESGIPQLFVVVSGVDTDVFETYDTYNKKRSTSDHLFVRGEHNPKVLADALNWLVPRVDIAKAAEAKSSTQRWVKPGVLHLQRKAVLAEHPQIRSFVNKYAALKVGLRIPKGLLATLEYMMALQDAEQAALFMSYLMEPVHLDETDAAYVFRQWFDALPQKRRTKKDYCRIADGVTVSWNALRKGETITAIKIPHAPLAFL
jgi:hypothetical protein